jgi:acetyltransferase-like isoleucine patch superfamily enzyme
MPWIVGLELRRLLLKPLVSIRFNIAGIRTGKGWRVYGLPILQRHRDSAISLGDDLVLRSWPASNPLAPAHPVVLSTRRPGARITIGNQCGFTGASIIADIEVTIGSGVLAGANVTIADTDFHPLEARIREANLREGTAKPVRIGDNVFIGMNSVILKGVTIGRASVIGAGSVVTSDIPDGVVAAGNPCRVIRELEG